MMRNLGTDRGVSIAVTHVLTIGITTILIAGLLFGAGSLLSGESDRSTDRSLHIIGEELSGEVSSVDRLAGHENDTIAVTSKQPRMVAGSSYEVELQPTCDEEAPVVNETQPCLALTGNNGDVAVYVPVILSDETNVERSSVTGGPVKITYEGHDDNETEGTIALERGTR